MRYWLLNRKDFPDSPWLVRGEDDPEELAFINRDEVVWREFEQTTGAMGYEHPNIDASGEAGEVDRRDEITPEDAAMRIYSKDMGCLFVFEAADGRTTHFG